MTTEQKTLGLPFPSPPPSREREILVSMSTLVLLSPRIPSSIQFMKKFAVAGQSKNTCRTPTSFKRTRSSARLSPPKRPSFTSARDCQYRPSRPGPVRSSVHLKLKAVVPRRHADGIIMCSPEASCATSIHMGGVTTPSTTHSHAPPGRSHPQMAWGPWSP